MPLYIDEVEAQVTTTPGLSGTGDHGLSREQLEVLVEAVIGALQERAMRKRNLEEGAAIAARSRPPSLGD